jgi:hypothetical protein
MSKFLKILTQLFIQYKVVLLALFLGLALIVQSLGLNLSRMPGDLGDTRFNVYILEHFMKWISQTNQSYWDAPFFLSISINVGF